MVRAANDTLKNSIDTAQITLATFAATDTTLTVTDATDIDVNDLLKINDEIMKVTAVSGTDLTVDRAQLATTAVLHPASSQIMLIEPGTSSPINNSGVTITDSATTIPVTSAATLGATVNGYVRIDDEILQVTAIAGNDLTVTRAVLGTAAAAHTDGVDVTRQVVLPLTRLLLTRPPLLVLPLLLSRTLMSMKQLPSLPLTTGSGLLVLLVLTVTVSEL